MRKLAFLSVFILGGLTLDSAHAACSLIDSCSGANEYLTIPGTTGCYECDKSQCPNGTVISATKATLEGKTYTNTMFTCHIENSGDLWRAASVPECTKQRYLLLKNDDNAHRVMINPNSDTPVVGNSGGAIAVVGVEACIGYVCDTGYTESGGKCVKPNANCPLQGGTKALLGRVINNNRCNPSNPSTGLSDTTHVKSGNVCNVTCVAGGWDVKLNNDACESGYEPDSSKKKCVETAASRQQRQRQEQQRRENESKKEKCEESGGTWASNRCSCDAAKNLRLEAGECKCLDDVNYKRSTDGKRCDLTDAAALQRKCEAAASAGAVWDGTKCTCSDAKKIWNGSTCIANPNIAKCEAIPGAKWSNGECKCKDADKEMNEDGTECVETEEARKKREEALKKAEQDAAKARITSITGKLNSLKAGLKSSVWKNKEGNFNTSRLVSDSVAGVVLGTAGGLITSNVIKKNQIKGGFEDINCTVRGQVVAGYGDDFQVGIQ